MHKPNISDLYIPFFATDKDTIDKEMVYSFNYDLPKKIEQYQIKARNKIKYILIQKFGKNNKYLDLVCSQTESTMNELYGIKENITDSHFSMGFLGWIYRVYYIPFYQSLGDTIGYRNGEWEFNNGNKDVGPEYANEMLADFIHLGGINNLSIVNWKASDDTLLYLPTYLTLLQGFKNINEYGEKLREAYLDAWTMMDGRAPGETTARYIDIQRNTEWDKIYYDPKAIGNGACMRSGCIGIVYAGKSNRKRLIALAIECSRITHNSTTSMLGSITTALFTAYALERIPINYWPHKLLNLIRSNKIDDYLKKSRPNEYKLYERDSILFKSQWESYIAFRFDGLNVKTNMKSMHNPVLRIKNLSERFSKANPKNPGGCADDACIIAYDSLLESGDNIEKLLVYSILHNGDSDTVGSIAFQWFGANYFSMKNLKIVKPMFDELEFRHTLNFLSSNALIDRLLKTYSYDLYINHARKIIKRLKH